MATSTPKFDPSATDRCMVSFRYAKPRTAPQQDQADLHTQQASVAEESDEDLDNVFARELEEFADADTEIERLNNIIKEKDEELVDKEAEIKRLKAELAQEQAKTANLERLEKVVDAGKGW